MMETNALSHLTLEKKYGQKNSRCLLSYLHIISDYFLDNGIQQRLRTASKLCKTMCCVSMDVCFSAYHRPLIFQT